MSKEATIKRRAQILAPLARVWTNPIIVKEIRTQMRGLRAFSILTGYLLGLGLLAYGLYRIILARAFSYYGPGGAPQSAFVGQGMFIAMAFLELLFVCYVTPALTAGTISGEHERRTYDMLMATRLRPAAILWGKLVPALTYVLLLILAAIPLSSIVFLFGGVVLRDMLQAIILLAVVAVAYGTLGVFFSALTRRTGRAMALSYGVVVALTGGTLFVWIAISSIRSSPAPVAILYANPLSALGSAIIQTDAVGPVLGVIPFADVLYYQTGGPEISAVRQVVAAARPLWQYTVAIYAAGAALLCLLTAQLVKPVRRWRLSGREIAAYALALVLLAGGLYGVFGTSLGSTGWTPQTPVVEFELPIFRAVEPEIVVAVATEAPAIAMPTSLPPPTTTPAPPPPPFDASEQAAEIEDHLGEHVLPSAEHSFCDLAIIDSQTEGITARVFGWAYCRSFEAVGDQLFAGAMASGPVRMDLLYYNESGWQVEGLKFGDVIGVWPDDLQEKLLAHPYDEAAGGARVREEASSLLTGATP